MRKVNIVFDSSSLYSSTDAIVCSEFEDFHKEFSNKFDFKIYIPEVVRGELCYQKVSRVVEKLKKAKELLLSIGKTLDRMRKTPYKIEELRPLFEKKFDKWAKKKNIILLKTPYNKISLKELQEKSIWRIPPFEDVKRGFEQCKKCRAEKGFRDALILISLLGLVKKITKNKVYFICSDKLLIEAVNNENKYERLILLEKIEELSSRLRLSFEEDNEKWITLISNKARDVFYKRVWEDCKIEEEIEERYPEHFKNPSRLEFIELSSLGGLIDTSSLMLETIYSYKPITLGSSGIYDPAYRIEQPECVPLDEGRYLIDNPSFQEVKNNNIYIWKSRVSHQRKYRDPWDTGIIIPKVYKINFDVIWSARVTKDERFYNLKLLDVKFINKEFTQEFPLSL